MESIPTTTKIVKKKKLQLVKILDEPEPIPNPEIIFDTLPVPIKNQVQQEGEIIPLNLEEPVVVDDTIEPLTQPQPQPSVQTETENQENQEKISINKQQRQKNKSVAKFLVQILRRELRLGVQRVFQRLDLYLLHGGRGRVDLDLEWLRFR